MDMISRKTPLRRRKKARVARPLRVGILTLPLHINYGGIIQAAALYRMIEDMGHHPVFLDKKPKRSLPHRLSKRLLASIPGQNIGNVREAVRNMNVHTPFVRRFLSDATRPLLTGNDLARAVKRRKLGAGGPDAERRSKRRSATREGDVAAGAASKATLASNNKWEPGRVALHGSGQLEAALVANCDISCIDQQRRCD